MIPLSTMNTLIRASINLLDKTAPITQSVIILHIQERMVADMEAEVEAGEMGMVGTDQMVIPPHIVAANPVDSQQMDLKLLTGEEEM